NLSGTRRHGSPHQGADQHHHGCHNSGGGIVQPDSDVHQPVKVELIGDEPWSGTFPGYGAVAATKGWSKDVPPLVAKGLINSGRFRECQPVSIQGAGSPEAGGAARGQLTLG